MKWSKGYIFTLREAPSDAEIESHKLLIRGGYIKKLAPGIYTYQNLALRTLRKIENIIREELDKAGCIEILMPMVQPLELWAETGRDGYPELLRFKNKNDQDFCLGATHEEVVTDIIRKDIHSYRDLPKTLYQIQTKYRDEIRPRFGLMRGREFLMKDAYSFDVDKDAALLSYKRLFHAYRNIFDRLGLDYRTVKADSGAIGGNLSQEFQVLAESGEDQILYCNNCDYAANVEIAQVFSAESESSKNEFAELEQFDTPNEKTISDLSKLTGIEESKLVKTMFFKDQEGHSFIILLRGSDEANPVKIKNALDLADLPEMLNEEEVRKISGAYPGSCGPVGLDLPIYSDQNLKGFSNFIVGANADGKHYRNVNFNRDFENNGFFDLVLAKEGDTCTQCHKGIYGASRGIEVGHVFYLGTKYSKAMNANYLDKNGKSQRIEMGCYGIGVGRTLQAAIEQKHDKDGIKWPVALAPFHVHFCLLDPKDESLSEEAHKIYGQLWSKGIEVLMDDRDERPGIKFKDADLIGMPFRVTLGKKGFDKGELEFFDRHTGEKGPLELKGAAEKIREIVQKAQ